MTSSSPPRHAVFDPTTEIFATDATNRYVLEGKTFRDAYCEVKVNLEQVDLEDPHENIQGKIHLGAPGNLGLDILEKRLAEWA